MATAASTSVVQQLQAAANYLLLGQAEESPAHVDFIQRLANAAVASGFTTSQGRFMESMKLKPFSTLTLFLAYLGGTTASQSNTQTVSTLPVP